VTMRNGFSMLTVVGLMSYIYICTIDIQAVKQNIVDGEMLIER
jgi:hypothetical protein